MTQPPGVAEQPVPAIAAALETLAPATRRAYQASLSRLGALGPDVALDDTTLSAALRTMADAGYSAATLRCTRHGGGPAPWATPIPQDPSQLSLPTP